MFYSNRATDDEVDEAKHEEEETIFCENHFGKRDDKLCKMSNVAFED